MVKKWSKYSRRNNMLFRLCLLLGKSKFEYQYYYVICLETNPYRTTIQGMWRNTFPFLFLVPERAVFQVNLNQGLLQLKIFSYILATLLMFCDSIKGGSCKLYLRNRVPFNLVQKGIFFSKESASHETGSIFFSVLLIS